MTLCSIASCKPHKLAGKTNLNVAKHIFKIIEFQSKLYEIINIQPFLTYRMEIMYGQALNKCLKEINGKLSPGSLLF